MIASFITVRVFRENSEISSGGGSNSSKRTEAERDSIRFVERNKN